MFSSLRKPGGTTGLLEKTKLRQCSWVSVKRIKLLAFALSGLMAGAGAVFSLITVGSTSQQMGVFLEIRVIMAIFLGGVLVTGGSSAKFYKIFLGSFSIQIIINGLALINRSDSHISQSVQGILLLLMLLVSVIAEKRSRRTRIYPTAIRPIKDEPDSGEQAADSKNAMACIRMTRFRASRTGPYFFKKRIKQ